MGPRLLAHAYQAIVGCDHEEAVVGLAAKHTEDSGAQIPLMARQVSEADDFGRSVANFFPRQLATSSRGHYDLTFAVETHDFHTD